MHSPNPPGTSWRRSFRSHVSLDKYERVPLMENYDSPNQSHKRESINEGTGDKGPILPSKSDTSSRPLRTIGDLLIVFLVLLLSETARGIVLPTLSPYVNMIGGNAVMLGYAVAAFSVGRFVSTIGLGYLSTTSPYKKVLGWSVAICVVGNLMYSLAYFLGPYFLLASRFITGFGAGTLSVIRAYVAHVTTPQERTSYMSILGAVQFFGFAIMPGAGSLLTYIPRFYLFGAAFDKYTLPGYFLAVANLALLILLVLEFKNPPPLISQIGGPKSAPSSPATTPVPPHLPPLVPPPTPPAPPSSYGPPPAHPQSPQLFVTAYAPQSPHLPAAIFVSPQFQPPSPHSPTLHSPLFVSPTFPHSPQLRYYPQQTTEPGSPPPSPSPPSIPPLSTKRKFLIFGVFLVLNLMVRLVLGIIETIATPVYIDLNDNKPGKDVEAGFVFGGMGLVGMGVLFLISYLSKHIQDFIILVTGLATIVLGAGLLIGNITMARFIIGCGLIWCVGYPLAQTIIVSMFSKMLGSKPQGTWMGWIGAMGSLGRIVGPIVSGFLLHNFGQSETMMFGTAVAVVALLTSLLLLGVKDRQPEK